MRSLSRSHRALWIALGDVVLTLGAYMLAFQIRLGGFPEYNWNGFVRLAPTILVTTLLLLVVYNQYRELHRPFLDVAAGGVLTAIGVGLIAGLGAYLDVEARAFPRSILLLGSLFHAVLLPLWRVWFVRDIKRRYFQRPAVLITNRPAISPRFPAYIRLTRRCSPQSFFADEARYQNHLVIVDSDVAGQDREQLVEWAATLANDLYLIPTLHDVMMNGGRFTKLGDRPVITVRPLTVPPEYRWLKRTTDLFASLILLLIFSPALLLIPLIIYLDTGGPTLFRQIRLGENGRIFRMYKFRTMVVDAEQETGAVLAAKDDPRITRVGRFLRATRLDELPQIINVLKGDMSIVGPRPERPDFVLQYAANQPNFRLRELVRPGVTGFAQVMGRYLTRPEDKLRFDLLYIARYSPLLDLRILLWTVQVVLFPQVWIDSPPTWALELDWDAESTRESRHTGD